MDSLTLWMLQELLELRWQGGRVGALGLSRPRELHERIWRRAHDLRHAPEIDQIDGRQSL